MKAARLIHDKRVLPDGAVVEVVIWRVPRPVPPSAHGYKYRLAYVVGGVRVVGFDNERGKGEYMHVQGHQRPYQFTTLAALLDDFEAEVVAVRGGPI
ncbi:MAG: hypothetical protein JOY66_05505 [Acetobacteraceae bacterium]|nr:hypothetical protein [Acetobacteraceae bacterium]